MLSLTYIYAHLEPDSDEIRYIGKADDPQGRLLRHIIAAKKEDFYNARWLNSLTARGARPRLEIIAEVPLDEWKFWERHYIKYFRDLGFKLTNKTPGGEGLGAGAEHPMFGRTQSAETRARISAASAGKNNPRFGKTQSAETRQKIGAMLRGKKRPPFSSSTRAKMSAAMSGARNPMFGRVGAACPNFGKSASPETRAKLSAALSGENHPWFGRTGAACPNFGKKHSAEHNAKIGAAQLGRKHSLKALENMRRARAMRCQREQRNNAV